MADGGVALPALPSRPGPGGARAALRGRPLRAPAARRLPVARPPRLRRLAGPPPHRSAGARRLRALRAPGPRDLDGGRVLGLAAHSS
ncbi:MAG: hypothetical protein B7Z69_00750 [Actinobacteria bacterium 21-73-9]|nr:MAG: hypothetical protein B7Z69_00750 [Actinobacteria bacterium 21-73-9]